MSEGREAADARPAPDSSLVDQVAEAMTGWPMDSTSHEDADSWRANARAAINAVREHDGKAGWRALIDAANTWQHGEWANAPRRADRVQERIANGQYVGDWLRARAASLPGPTAPDPLDDLRRLAEGWVGFDDSHRYGDAVLKLIGLP